ncbi:MAG: hypothetical protein IKM72_14695, partial [Oscillospiraceae bacterium]|nr:hypothetical protein [Oscillospiraceae bacterium]
YYIQLAHTTNINFSYDIYKAHTDDINGTVSYIMNDANRTEVKYLIDATPITGSYVNGTVDSGKTIGNKLYNDPSYYDDSEDASKSDKRQKNAEPLYWQSSATVDGKAAGYNEYNTAYQTENPRAFLNYYVIRVSWGANQVTNDKETDLVYITVELG